MSLDVVLLEPIEERLKEWETKKEKSLKEAEGLKGLIPLIETYYSERKPDESKELFSYNITHNLNSMAEEAGIYKHLWRPEELGITKAVDLILPLTEGLKRLIDNPEHYKTFTPENKWGSYEGLVAFVNEYRDACIEFPTATIYVSR